MTKEKSDEEAKQSASVQPNWVTLKPAELEKIIVDLHKQGEPPAKIGLILRDKYGVPKAKLLGKRISQILKISQKEVKTDKDYTKERIKQLESHISKHSHDYTAKRLLTKKLWMVK